MESSRHHGAVLKTSARPSLGACLRFDLDSHSVAMPSFWSVAALAGFGAATAINYPRQANGSTAYTVQTPPLDTPWTYEVGTNPWPQYPRPQLKRSQWQSLNGIWTYQNASSLDAVNSPPFGQTLANEVLVPSCLESGLSGTTVSISLKYRAVRTANRSSRHSRTGRSLLLVRHNFRGSI